MATYVLLHGAYHSGWHFHLLARELESRGTGHSHLISPATIQPQAPNGMPI